MMVPKLAIIKWKDAFEGPPGWVHYEEYAPKPVLPLTVGWVMEDEKMDGYLNVYSTFFYDDGCMVVADPNHIPMEMVIDIKYFDI